MTFLFAGIGAATISTPFLDAGEGVRVTGDLKDPDLDLALPPEPAPTEQAESVESGDGAPADDPVVSQLVKQRDAAIDQSDDAVIPTGTEPASPDEIESTSDEPAPDGGVAGSNEAVDAAPDTGPPASEESGDGESTANDPASADGTPAAVGETTDGTVDEAVVQQQPATDETLAEEKAAPQSSANDTGGRVRLTDTDEGCTSDYCPSGIGLELTDIGELSAAFDFFFIPETAPTFTLQRSFPADDDPAPARLAVTDDSLTINGLVPGTEYVLRADRNFGFDAGSAAEVIYFQTLSPIVNRFCNQVETPFEDDLIMQRDGDLYSSVTPIALDPHCAPYQVWLRSADYNHTIGFQPYQLGEQWQLEGLDAAGDVLYRSPSTSDLGEAEITSYQLIDEMSETSVTQVRAFHTGPGNINSVRAWATFIPVNANPRTPSLCGTLDVLFINPTLANGTDEAAKRTVGMPNPAKGREYEIWLYSRDDDHALGQSGGAAEQWFVEGLDADGNVVYTSPVTPDLPDDEVLSQTYVGTVTLDGIATFRGRHLGRMGENSIEVSMMLVPVDVELPDDPYPTWCKYLNVQRP